MYSGDEYYDDEVTSGLLERQPRKDDPVNTHEIFENDMEAAGYIVEHYHGRNWWHGPAVRVESPGDFQDVVRATSVKVQQDSMGLGLIVYPVQNREDGVMGCTIGEEPESLVDIGFVVSVNEVPAHLADLVRAYIGMHLDVLTSELASGLDEAELDVHGVKSNDLSDEDADAIANLSSNVSEMVR